METVFEIAGGSVAGRDHVKAGKNGHDAYGWYLGSDCLVAVVTDGCGSGKHSEVGAKLAVPLLINSIRYHLEHSLEQPLTSALETQFGEENPTSSFWERVRSDVLAQIRVLALAMGGSFSRTVSDYFLFTVLGALITPVGTCLFSIGDGRIELNGEVIPLGPFPDNEPPYLTYALVETSLSSQDPGALKFQTRVIPTQELQTLLIATDGGNDLAASAGKHLPGKDELIGPLSQFLATDLFYVNPDAIRRRLMMANREIIRPDWGNQRMRKEVGHLPDDTTIVAIRRRQSGHREV